MRCVSLILGKLLDTQNVAFSAPEKFLEAFEVGEFLENLTKRLVTQNFLGYLELDFIKIPIGEVFAAPFFLRVVRI